MQQSTPSPLKPMPLCTDEGMAEVDLCIQDQLRSEVALVETVCRHIIQGGGKRIRPRLLLLADASIGEAPHPDAVRLATVIEFIHTATLLHDDVVDESDLRRGQATANAAFGNAASVLVGDFLYSRAFQLMVQTGSVGVMAMMAEATNTIAEGEVLQLMNCRDPDTTEARYLQVIRYKTARLFEAACALPAVVRSFPADIVEALAAYGRHLGTAFQIADDLLDYFGDEASIGKAVGDDLREGKPTLPLIYLMAHGSDAEQAQIRQVITDPESADLEGVIRLVVESGAQAYCQKLAEQEAALARLALEVLPDTQAKAYLIDLPDYVVQRRG